MNKFLRTLPMLAAATLLFAPSLRADEGSKAAGLDSNQDGLVSRAEAEYDGKLKLEFDSLDANKDGRLDSSEIAGLQAPTPGVSNAPTLNSPARASSSSTTTGGTTPATPSGTTSSSGPGMPSAPGLPSGGGRVAAPAGAAPSPGARSGSR